MFTIQCVCHALGLLQQTPTKEEQVMDVVEKEEDATMDASSPIKTTSSPLSADSAGQKTPSSSGRPSPAKRPK